MTFLCHKALLHRESAMQTVPPVPYASIKASFSFKRKGREEKKYKNKIQLAKRMPPHFFRLQDINVNFNTMEHQLSELNGKIELFG